MVDLAPSAAGEHTGHVRPLLLQWSMLPGASSSSAPSTGDESNACSADPNKRLDRINKLGLYMRVEQQHSMPFKRIANTAPLLIAVRRGAKLVSYRGHTWRAGAGDVLVLPMLTPHDALHEVVEGAAPRYVADVLCIAPQFLSTVDAMLANYPPLQEPAVISGANRGFLEALSASQAALSAADDLPSEVVAHRLALPLLWLADLLGHRLACVASISKLVRSLVCTDLSHDWMVEEAADRLRMSASSLKRGLVSQATSFAEVLTDARMCEGLARLQGTDARVIDVAASVGYSSQSRFAARFKRQFSVAPSKLRGHNRGN